MDYQVIKAKNIAYSAIRKANKKKAPTPEVYKRKKMAMRQYRKMVEAKKSSQVRIDNDFSKYIEWAILATIGLAVLSVSYPQVGILAIIFAILIVAAIMDTKIKNMGQKTQKEAEERMERLVRLVNNEKKVSAIEVKSKEKVLTKTAKKLSFDDLSGTITEFPYKKVQ
jgi:Flp pilus assembly protein TadB